MSVLYDITADSLAADGARVLHAGNDYEHDFVLKRGGQVLVLTGAKVWFTIKEDAVVADAAAKLQLDSSEVTEIEITVDGALLGELTVKFIAASTAGLEGLWQYDMKVKLVSGKIHTHMRGVIEFLPILTRATT